MIAAQGALLESVSGDEMNMFGWAARSSAELNTQYSATEGATFSLLRTNIISGGSGTNNFRFRDAGADGNQLASIAGTGVAEDAVNTDALTAGDLFNIAYTDTGSNSVTSWLACNVDLSSGYGCFHGSAGYVAVVHDVASATRYISLSGHLPTDGNTTEANVGFKARGYDTFAALQVRVTANARTNDSIFRNRINGGDGSAVVTFAAGVTGLVVDDGLSDAIGDGQIICASITLDTGVEDLAVCMVGATLKSTTVKQDVWLHRAMTRAASATAHYLPIGGYGPDLAVLTEAQARCKIGYAGTASNLRCYLSANTYTVDGTLKLYQNGSAVITTTLTLLGGAAWYENASDTVTFDADDEFSFEFVGGTTGSATINSVGLTLAPDVASGLGIPIAAYHYNHHLGSMQS